MMSGKFKSAEKKREKQLIGDRPWIDNPNTDDSKLTKRLKRRAIRDIPLAHELKQKALARWEIYDALSAVSGRPFELFMVGSCSNFTGLKKCDLDLCLVTERDKSRDQIESTLHFIMSTIKERHEHFKKFNIIMASVPILRFVDTQRDLPIDLNINGRNSIKNSALIRTYLSFDNRARPLVMSVKRMARTYEINDASNGGLSSYCLALMVIFYLQHCKVLPTLPESYLTLKSQDPLYIFHKHDNFESSNKQDLGDLFKGFMKFYAYAFDFEKHVVSVRLGKLKLKTNAMSRDNIDGIENREKDWGPLCIEEPFFKTNASKSVQRMEQHLEIIGAFKVVYKRIDLGIY